MQSHGTTRVARDLPTESCPAFHTQPIMLRDDRYETEGVSFDTAILAVLHMRAKTAFIKLSPEQHGKRRSSNIKEVSRNLCSRATVLVLNRADAAHTLLDTKSSRPPSQKCRSNAKVLSNRLGKCHTVGAVVSVVSVSKHFVSSGTKHASSSLPGTSALSDLRPRGGSYTSAK